MQVRAGKIRRCESIFQQSYLFTTVTSLIHEDAWGIKRSEFECKKFQYPHHSFVLTKDTLRAIILRQTKIHLLQSIDHLLLETNPVIHAQLHWGYQRKAIYQEIKDHLPYPAEPGVNKIPLWNHEECEIHWGIAWDIQPRLPAKIVLNRLH